jgi:anti-sigma regulatory factor (Ser/Thr protein kinase)
VVDTLNCRIVTDAASLRQVSAWLRERCATAGLPAEVSDRLELCVNEAVANVIIYGNRDDGGRQIQVSLICEGQGAEVSVVDDGRPFNPLSRPSPTFADSIDRAQVGGFGIHLVREFSDAVSYHRDDGHNRLTLQFRKRGG